MKFKQLINNVDIWAGNRKYMIWKYLEFWIRWSNLWYSHYEQNVFHKKMYVMAHFDRSNFSSKLGIIYDWKPPHPNHHLNCPFNFSLLHIVISWNFLLEYYLLINEFNTKMFNSYQRTIRNSPIKKLTYSLYQFSISK